MYLKLQKTALGRDYSQWQIAFFREELSKAAAACGLVCSIIRDAGRTQIASGSKTVLAVGPGKKIFVNKFPQTKCLLVRYPCILSRERNLL